jgi:hypothetical protein
MRIKWNKEEDNYLISNYPTGIKEEIQIALKRSWFSIQSRASKLKIGRTLVVNDGKENKIWSEIETTFLINNYLCLDKKELVFKLNRSWSSIRNKLNLLKLKLPSQILNANSLKLINETNESYYWLGFIMADGHFSKNNQIQINLNKKDLNHLKLFATFIEYKKVLTKPNLSISYTPIKNYLIENYKIDNNKTINPCNLDKLSGDEFFSLIIGFIDGDGSINKKGYLSITSHSNWYENIKKMFNEISNNKHFGIRINSNGYTTANITNIETMKKIKNKIIELNLPILQRKWVNVNIEKLSKIEKNNKLKNICYDFFNKGLKPKEIVKKTNISSTFVYKNYLEYNLLFNGVSENKKEIFKKRKEEIIKLVLIGTTNEEIMKEIKTSLITIYRIRQSIKKKDSKRDIQKNN